MQKKSIFILVAFLPFFLFGCAATPDRIAKHAMQNSQEFDSPKIKLSEFSSAKLEPVEMVNKITTNPKKLQSARELEVKLKTLIDPLVTEWPTKGTEGRALIIQPKLVHLRIISGTTRFFTGLMSGQSSISMELALMDSKTGQIIANPQITKTSLASGSPGVTDSNLQDYIANIAHQYLLVNM